MADSAFRTGRVFVQGIYAGTVAETDSGYRFQYAADYLSRAEAVAASLTLPLRAEPYESHTLFPFFDGLIPEGWLLQVAVDNWKLNPKDRFGLLLAVSADNIGDVTIRPAAPVDAPRGKSEP